MTPLRKLNRGEGIVSRKPRPKSAHDFLGLLYCFIVLLLQAKYKYKSAIKQAALSFEWDLDDDISTLYLRKDIIIIIISSYLFAQNSTRNLKQSQADNEL